VPASRRRFYGAYRGVIAVSRTLQEIIVTILTLTIQREAAPPRRVIEAVFKLADLLLQSHLGLIVGLDALGPYGFFSAPVVKSDMLDGRCLKR
jgi:hypothetical protein